ncbi:hypothetical protein apy_01280 [Aeropyrum pernix]|uniref:DHHA1 domain-containing protein n=1 Tax=Aeropyrum pernix TaxID=56636 RepID=A0A401H7M3_AERPX|nr:hypothetical protein apy_01280 [Aeropyrum pernix]
MWLPVFKVRLSPGGEFEKGFEAASSGFRRVVEAAEDYGGVVRIYSYPSRDSLVAGAYLFKRLLALGLRPVAGVSVKPPPVLSPTVLLGYDSLQYKATEVEHPVFAVSSGELRGTPVMNVYMVEAEGSVSAAAAIASSEVVGYRGSWDVMVALAGCMAGRYVERNGRFHGLDRMLLDELGRIEVYGLEVVTSLKAYKPMEGGVCDAIARTVNPYYPKMTGDPGYCAEVLRGEGLGGLASRSLYSVSDKEELSRLVSTILSHVSRYTQRLEGEELVEEYVGGYPISTAPGAPVADARMALDALTMAMELGGLEGLLATVMDLEREYPIAEAALEDLARGFEDLLSRVKPRRVKSHPRLRLYLLGQDAREAPLYLLWRALQLTGVVERDSVVAVEDGEGGAVASAPQAEDALGVGSVRRIVESRLGRLEGLRLWLDVNALQR